MNVKQVAKRLEVSISTIYSLIASGKLRHYRIGNGRGVVRVSEERLAAYLKSSEPAVTPPPAPASSIRLKHLNLS
jgi:excisionase family DNA binding protein